MFGSNFGPISTYRHNWRNDQPTNQQMRHYIRVISIGWLTVTVWQISTWTIPINRTRRYSLDCIRQVMCAELHWLRVTDRINYKLCLLVYKALHGFAPDLPVWTLYSGIQCQLPITFEIRTPRWSYCAANPTCEIWSAGICLCYTMRLELLTNWPERLTKTAVPATLLLSSKRWVEHTECCRVLHRPT